MKRRRRVARQNVILSVLAKDLASKFKARFLVSTLGMTMVLASYVDAQEKKDDKKDTPRIACGGPIALLANSTTTVKLRGQFIDEATAVKASVGEASIKSKGKSEAPKPFDAAKAGDCEVVIELKLPAGAAEKIAFTLTTPKGETAPFEIAIVDAKTHAPEKESNGGFKQAQELAPGTTIIGAVENPMDVDVYRINARAGQKLVARVSAEKRGSLLDASLSIYDANGQLLASADDSGDSRDPVLTFVAPADGTYFLSLIDASDRGSAAHGYLLSLSAE